MRGIQLQFSKFQKLRLQKALEQQESQSFNCSVTVADSILVNHEDRILKGHGTADLNGEVVATLCGVVERVDKYVCVRALRSRYKPKAGDIVIGRVIEVGQNRWRLDINCGQNAYMMLSAMNMPDGVQAEVVRDFQHDGLYLQARSKKYGKLSIGQQLTVAPYLVKRQNQHFHHLEQYGIDLILGCNGFIWVGEHVEARDDMIEDQINQSDQQVLIPSKNSVSLEEQEKNYTAPETSEYICRAANAVRVLSTLGFILTLEIIKGVIDLSLSVNLDIHDMLGSEFCVLVAEKEAESRSSNKNL